MELKRRVLGVLGRVLQRGRGRDRHDLGGTDWEARPEPISLIETHLGAELVGRAGLTLLGAW